MLISIKFLLPPPFRDGKVQCIACLACFSRAIGLRRHLQYRHGLPFVATTFCITPHPVVVHLTDVVTPGNTDDVAVAQLSAVVHIEIETSLNVSSAPTSIDVFFEDPAQCTSDQLTVPFSRGHDSSPRVVTLKRSMEMLSASLSVSIVQGGGRGEQGACAKHSRPSLSVICSPSETSGGPVVKSRADSQELYGESSPLI